MDRLNFYPPLGHHVGRYRRIDASGEQAHGSAAHAGGQAAGTGQSGTMDISGMVPDLYEDRIVGVVDIHGNAGVSLRQTAADFLGNGNGAHGKLLIGPLGLHFK